MKIVPLAVFSAILALALPAQAQQTNVVQNITIFLRGVQPGGRVATRYTVTTGIGSAGVDTRDVIRALGAATGTSFLNSARLVVVTPLGGGDSSIEIRDRNTRLDVTPFFSHQQLSDSVSGSVSNTVTHRTTQLDYNIQRFTLHDAEWYPPLSLHFDVNGFANERSSENLPGVSNTSVDVSGGGDADGTLMILQGIIDVEGSRLEVVTGGGGGTT